MQVSKDGSEIKVNVDNLFLRGRVIINVEDLIEIFQYSIDNNIVNATKRKGKTTVSKVKTEKYEKVKQ